MTREEKSAYNRQWAAANKPKRRKSARRRYRKSPTARLQAKSRYQRWVDRTFANRVEYLEYLRFNNAGLGMEEFLQWREKHRATEAEKANVREAERARKRANTASYRQREPRKIKEQWAKYDLRRRAKRSGDFLTLTATVTQLGKAL